MAQLFVVSTPIGNLADLTHRAEAVLRSVARVLAEDTRHTRILFRKYGIETPLISAHEHNERQRSADLLRWLEQGEDIALVSDAGTPLVSDPGARLVRAVIEAGHDVVPVPGPSALLAALVGSGMALAPFVFHGFPPRSGREREALIAEAGAFRGTSVFYEAPNRLAKWLADLETVCGGSRNVVVARELTKLHETWFRGTLAEASSYYASARVRGEIVVLLDGAPPPGPVEPGTAARLVRELIDSGEKPSSAARIVARQLGMSRRDAYRLAHETDTDEE